MTLVTWGCVEANNDSSADSAPTINTVSVTAVRFDRMPLIEGPRSPRGLKVILGTGDLGVGYNRVGFLLTSLKGFVMKPEVSLSVRYFATDEFEGEVRDIETAKFQQWPYGSRGMYTTWLNFDKPGRWGIDVDVRNWEDDIDTAQIFFEVLETEATPKVGDLAIRSKSKTVADVVSLDQISTGSLKDKDLYQVTLEAAMESGMPTVVVFASPAFCANAVCGPQVETLQRLKNVYKRHANFIHVDFYDNPVEIEGDLDRAILSPTVIEWNLPSIQWTFVIDSEGRVAFKFEAYVTYDELEIALQQVL